MQALSLTVVGHTNTGKTSLMRTLLRDGYFGEVANAAATTRHVESATIYSDHQPLIHLYDTPGLEDASGILDWLEQETATHYDGIERLQQFLANPIAQTEFSQEAKVLKQLLVSDAALYVIDAREPVLARYKDELTILSWCAKPIMPVFNFTAGQDLHDWQTMLARRNLHVYTHFDTIAFDFESEQHLWQNLATMLAKHNHLTTLMALRQREWQQLDHQAKQLIAHFLLEVAAYQQTLTSNQLKQLPEYQQHMQTTIRQLEHTFQQQLLHLYRFYRSELDAPDWALQVLTPDPFNREQLKRYGIRTSKGAATGALIGLGIDVLTLGSSLGVATAIGGFLGGLSTNLKSMIDKATGSKTLYIDATTITLLAARALSLLNTLQHRGHAAENQIYLNQQHTPWQSNQLPAILKQARLHQNWSSLNGEHHALAAQHPKNAVSQLIPYLQLPKNSSTHIQP